MYIVGGSSDSLSLMCDRCFECIRFDDDFKYSLESDWDFCGPCFIVLGRVENVGELDDFRSRDSYLGDLREFIRTCGLAAQGLELFMDSVGSVGGDSLSDEESSIGDDGESGV